MGGLLEGGQVYEARCANPGSPIEWDYLWAWFADPPPGTPVTPADLAQRATDSMTLLGPDIHTSVRAGGTGLVGVPVWLWTGTGPTRWGPNSATATVPGLSVTATARASKIVWELGDGTTLTCHGPGVPYDRASGLDRLTDLRAPVRAVVGALRQPHLPDHRDDDLGHHVGRRRAERHADAEPYQHGAAADRRAAGADQLNGAGGDLP